MPLTKANIVNKLNDHLGLSKKESLSAIESTFDIIKAELESGNDVKISGFGKWFVKVKKERKGRNPQTGESLTVTARRVVTFKTSPVLRDTINAQ